ncbi:MAG: glycosyltransferase family A protein, partial [bacterium]
MHKPKSVSKPSNVPLPKVSVVIPCYNLGRYLDDAVDSVLGQTFQDFEIIVVDDGSTDENTKKLLSSYHKPRTTVMTIENKGPAGARNAGIAQARAPFVLCLDADDVLEPTCLEKCCKVLEQEDEVGIAGFWYRAFGVETWEFRPGSCNLRDILVENRLCGNSMFRKSA